MNLYCRMPFGRLHRRAPEIIELARHLSRTPGAVAMKLVNLASLDPAHRNRGVKGLGHASELDARVWREFSGNWEAMSYESQKVFAEISPTFLEVTPTSGPTETKSWTRTRLVQGFFRAAILAGYKETCSFCGLSLPELLNAGHIIPWSENVERRADPTNGICLCALHDRAFDRGLMSVGPDMRIIVSPRAKKSRESELHRVGIIETEGKKILMPERFHPDPAAFSYHRSAVFASVS